MEQQCSSMAKLPLCVCSAILHIALFTRLVLLLGPKWLQWFQASYANNNIQAERGSHPCLMPHFKTEEKLPRLLNSFLTSHGSDTNWSYDHA